MNPRSCPAPHLPGPGGQVGPWLLAELYDAGAYGLVFRAQHGQRPEAGPFALKLAQAVEDPRFAREVALLQSLHHPSVPGFVDSGQYTAPSGARYPYLVMQWVQGQPLYSWAQGRTSREVLEVLAQLASALAAAHCQGALHRDVKGDNIRVTAQGRAVLLDWGAGVHRGALPLTGSGLPPGTAPYRSPEAVRWSWAHRGDGAPYQAGPEDDVYALGVTAYRLSTGQYPAAPEEHSRAAGRVRAARELATVSSGLDTLLSHCLSGRKRGRPQAHALAVSCLAAACAPDAPRPIAATPTARPPQPTHNPGPKPWGKPSVWVASAALGVMGLLGFVGGRGMERMSPSLARAEPSAPLARLRQAAHQDTVNGGVGHEALTEAQAVLPAGVPSDVIGEPIPPQAFPGQRKPPCERGETALNGACWAKVADEEPPCGPKHFEYEKHCYVAPIDATRSHPNSSQP